MTDADFLWKLLAAISLLGNLLLLWRKMGGKAEKRQIGPDPLNVREADRFVTEKELKPICEHLELHDKNIDGLRRELQANYNTLMTSDAEGRARLHQKIDTVVADVSQMKGIIEPLKGIQERFARDVGRLEGILQRHN